jgi:hypothetical protein
LNVRSAARTCTGRRALTTGIDRDRQRSAVVPIAVVDADLVFAVTPKVALIGETRAAGNVFTFLIKSDSLSTLRPWLHHPCLHPSQFVSDLGATR